MLHVHVIYWFEVKICDDGKTGWYLFSGRSESSLSSVVWWGSCPEWTGSARLPITLMVRLRQAYQETNTCIFGLRFSQPGLGTSSFYPWGGGWGLPSLPFPLSPAHLVSRFTFYTLALSLAWRETYRATLQFFLSYSCKIPVLRVFQELVIIRYWQCRANCSAFWGNHPYAAWR